MAELTVGDLWAAIGSLDELESMQLLSRLFTRYEALLESNPENTEALHFFDALRQEYVQVSECNLNRR